LLCQKKKQLNVRVRMSAKANRLPHRPANLCAKKWSTSGKANTAPDRQSKRSPLVYLRRGEREQSCPLQNAASSKQNARQSAISKRAAPDDGQSRLLNAHARRNERSSARAVARHQGRHCPDTRSVWRGNARHARVRLPRRKQRARESAGAEMLVQPAAREVRMPRVLRRVLLLPSSCHRSSIRTIR
jgi:hypothetical protein